MPRWVGLLLAAALLCAQTDPDAHWKAFLAWLSAQPPDSKPANLIRPYRAELIRKGMSPAEAEREMERVGNLAFTRPDGAKVLWNKVYAGHDPIFLQTPNALLASAIRGPQARQGPGFRNGPGPQHGVPRHARLGRHRLRPVRRGRAPGTGQRGEGRRQDSRGGGRATIDSILASRSGT
jgi:hypothetical protein